MSFLSNGLHYNEFFFLFHDWRSNIVHTMPKLQKTQGRYAGAMEMKSKLYLRIILLINYMMEENLFVYVECSSVKHAASRFSVRKNVTKKRQKESDTWMDWYLRSRSCQFFIQKFHVLHYADST